MFTLNSLPRSSQKNNSPRLAVGLMSGTSLDGVDAALISLTGFGLDVEYQLLAFETQPYPEALKKALKQVCNPKTSRVDELCSLNVELGYRYLQAVHKLLITYSEKSGISLQELTLDFIASHGQTIYHQPHPRPRPRLVGHPQTLLDNLLDDKMRQEGKRVLFPSTLQIGDPSPLAYHFKTPVVFNFRMMDMVVGGEGAPLVPYTDYLLFRSKEKARLLQNIGGIGNVTILPKNCSLAEVKAFDTGPGNMMMDYVAQTYFQKPFDNQGKLARKGQLIPELFNRLKTHTFLKKPPPKSTGREDFGEAYCQELCQELCQQFAPEPYNLLYTFTYFTAYSIAESYRTYIFPHQIIDEIIISGGGAYNDLLLELLQQELPNYTVIIQEDWGYSSEAKEAIAFALLGNETLHLQSNNVPQSTGAKEAVILGQIIPNPWARGYWVKG